jgi:mannose-6-phosphate isomerase-like protein (cupin superfamily)
MTAAAPRDRLDASPGEPCNNFRARGDRNRMSRVRKPVHIEPKGWGREVWIANNDLYCGKVLEIRKGKRCSLHYHKLKTESFYLRAGRLKVRVKDSRDSETVEEFEMKPGDCMDVPPGLVHQMEALEDAELIEFSTQHFDSDSHRLVRGD